MFVEVLATAITKCSRASTLGGVANHSIAALRFLNWWLATRTSNYFVLLDKLNFKKFVGSIRVLKDTVFSCMVILPTKGTSHFITHTTPKSLGLALEMTVVWTVRTKNKSLLIDRLLAKIWGKRQQLELLKFKSIWIAEQIFDLVYWHHRLALRFWTFQYEGGGG